jgi:molecular chaperone DnaK (HSP70)|tara:strand:- start:1241 stop:1423 length:183 start_codon:yes stop_codon:yes gene_type:complete
MKDYIIQEYNRKTKKYRSLGAVMARNKQEAKEKYIEISNWKPTKELLLHVEDSQNFKARP